MNTFTTPQKSARLAPLALVLLALGVAAAGCGGNPKTVAQEGSLQWADDGKPIVGATVKFVPTASGGGVAAGYTDKDGHFFLTTFSSGDGAMPGEYNVVITKIAASSATAAPPPGDDPTKAMESFYKKGKGASSAPTVTDPIPAAYGEVKSTPLKWVVDTTPKKAELKVNRK